MTITSKMRVFSSGSRMTRSLNLRDFETASIPKKVQSTTRSTEKRTQGALAIKMRTGNLAGPGIPRWPVTPTLHRGHQTWTSELLYFFYPLFSLLLLHADGEGGEENVWEGLIEKWGWG